MDDNHMLAPSASALVGDTSSQKHQNRDQTHNQALSPPPRYNFNGNFSDHSLPPLSSVTSSLPPASDMAASMPMTTDKHLPPINSLVSYQQPPLPMPPPPAAHKSDNNLAMDLDNNSNGSVSAASPDRIGRSGSVNIDDPDVRLAAEALEDLRAGMHHDISLVMSGTDDVMQTLFHLPPRLPAL